MIDFGVAYDKLASLETADEIADLFRQDGVKALRADTESCAVSVWMEKQTGMITRTNLSTVRAIPEHDVYEGIPGTTYNHTEAMRQFVMNFDAGEYTDLIRHERDRLECERGTQIKYCYQDVNESL